MTAPQSIPQDPSADRILQLGLGFWGSKVLLTAVELGVFTALAEGPADAEQLRRRLGVHARSAADFFDALVALGMLGRTDGRYANTQETDRFLDRAKPSYVGGILEMANHRLYGHWGHLTEAVRTGESQNEAKGGENTFESLYADPARLKLFLGAMTGMSLPSARAIAAKFPFARVKSVADVGCAQGALPVTLALAHPHLSAVGYDLPGVKPVFEEYAAGFDLGGRVAFRPGDFMKEPLPAADVLVMGHILHDWDLPTKQMLLSKAYDALPAGGALIVYESLIDDDRRTNAFGLLMSLNMLIETPGGFDYTGADCVGWMREAGFKDCRVEHLGGPESMVVGIK
ncbi:MAG: tcmO [Phycisphaerales bacterium]|nr:tcmO [Phycisphaerales bacterium]